MQNLCLWTPDQDRMQHSNLQQFMAEVGEQDWRWYLSNA